MSLWIKICGMTDGDAVAAAVEADVAAIGFVFAPSRRQVTPAQATRVGAQVPAKIARVAVMLHPTQSLVDEVIATFQPDILQTDAEDFAGLRLPRELARLPVCRPGSPALSPLPARILCEGATSGTGQTTDWAWARALAARTQVVLAGGLDAHNVAAAVAAVAPFGVDVSSGVERAPGVKDPERILEFVAAARAAHDRIDRGE
jgi:phosphoribosylanthranilate isomerase